ncbi:hypothetical protein G7Y89_g10648 [Cudoniella acicularis]|uniref:NADP-dependent oxidoreductase domain-containing protein n=1 Tax=Cudoniella acicularis TaxID=354080 RepID=A0A8H4RDF2_9HELO|nr:hypothetical protein G7Y89_g10648 [Cudoniella acicularis]
MFPLRAALFPASTIASSAVSQPQFSLAFSKIGVGLRFRLQPAARRTSSFPPYPSNFAEKPKVVAASQTWLAPAPSKPAGKPKALLAALTDFAPFPIVDFCQKNGIVIEAYCPLVRNQKANDPTLNSIATTHQKTTAQVLIRYCLQKTWVPLPKSDTPSRIIENANVYDFELSEEEMVKLDGLDQGMDRATRVIFGMEVEDLQHELEDYESLKRYTEDLRSRHKEMKERLVAAEKQTADLEKEVVVYKAAAESAEKEAESAKEQLERVAPLIDVGVRVRLRFMEQAQEHVLERKPEILNQEIILAGNAAAHGGFGRADALLFKLGFVPQGVHENLFKVFHDLYQIYPNHYEEMPAKLLEATNYEVTLKTMNVLNEGLTRPGKERQTVMENIWILRNKFLRLGIEEFEKDPDVDRRLAVIKELTATIVYADRRRRG